MYFVSFFFLFKNFLKFDLIEFYISFLPLSKEKQMKSLSFKPLCDKIHVLWNRLK